MVAHSTRSSLAPAHVPDLINVLNSGASRSYVFEEKFVYKISNNATRTPRSGKKTMMDSVNIMELFLIKDKLKGKKKPIKKKNHDAQQFSSRSEGEFYLETTRHFFTNFNVACNPLDINDNLKICKSELLNDICFVLACDPSFVFDGEQPPTEYFTRTYISLQKKKKIFKIPSKFILYLDINRGQIEISRDHSVLWFSNNTTTLSN